MQLRTRAFDLIRELLDEPYGTANMSGDFTDRVKKLRREIDKDATHQDRLGSYVEAAKRKAAEGELEVDDNALVSISGEQDPGGAYVLCWLWIWAEDR